MTRNTFFLTGATIVSLLLGYLFVAGFRQYYIDDDPFVVGPSVDLTRFNEAAIVDGIGNGPGLSDVPLPIAYGWPTKTATGYAYDEGQRIDDSFPVSAAINLALAFLPLIAALIIKHQRRRTL